MQEFDVNDLVVRKSTNSRVEHCGGLVIEFFTGKDDAALPSHLFEATQESLTVKSQPFGTENARGGYIVKYRAYLRDWERGAV